MSLPAFSIQRPVVTTMVTMIVVILGAVSLSRIQIDLLPSIELPTVSIRTEYPGASPEVVERLVTQIVEEIVATVPGVIELRSTSSQGSSNVRATFGWGLDVDTAALDVRSRLEDELNELPEGILRPQVRKFDISSFPVVILGISSKLDPVELTELIENQLRPRFSQIPDIAQADLWGGYPREIRVSLDLARIQALRIPMDSILAAIENANLDLPAGQIEEGRHEVTIRAPAEYQSLEEVERTVVAVRNGTTVTLGQIATINDTYEKLSRIVRVNGDQGLRLAIRKQGNANTVEVAGRVLAVAEQINREFPQIKVVPVINQGNFIERSIANVARSVLYGGTLSVLVLLFFLLSFRSTAVIAVAIPISIVATFAMIFFFGFTLNLMTLGGLALGVGMMVDSSIVVLENIFRRREEASESIATAAVNGAREVAPAITASTITTLVVFLPLAFVRGVSGALFRELAYVIVFSLVCSLIVSLTVLPMLASRVLSDDDDVTAAEVPQTGWVAWAQRFFAKLASVYQRVLVAALARPVATLTAVSLLFVASLLLLPYIGTEFLPPSDEGEVRISGEMEVGTRIGIVDQQTKQMESIVYPAVPEAIATVATVGASGRRPQDGALGQIQLSVGAAIDRQRSNSDIAEDLRRRLEGQIAGMKIRVRAPQGSFILQRILRSEDGISIDIQGFELETLDAVAREAARIAATVDGITDVEVSRRSGVPQQQIQLDRAKIADLGLTARDVTRALQVAVAGVQAGEYRKAGNAYRIWVQLADVETVSIDDILGLTLTTSANEPVYLQNLVATRPNLGPLVIERKNQQRLVSVVANVAGRPLGDVAVELEEKLRQIPLPSGYAARLSGAFEEQKRSFRDLLASLALALVLVYMVLASQYESFKSPIVVMVTVPLAAIGVLILLFATSTTLNVQSYIGCIMLGGIVVNNAILLVDQSGALRREGLDVQAAVIEAGRRRLRPILMTTLTTILGLVPLALGIGEGADAQAPLARAVIGGLVGATPITLVLIPVVYRLVYRDQGRPC